LPGEFNFLPNRSTVTPTLHDAQMKFMIKNMSSTKTGYRK